MHFRCIHYRRKKTLLCHWICFLAMIAILVSVEPSMNYHSWKLQLIWCSFKIGELVSKRGARDEDAIAAFKSYSREQQSVLLHILDSNRGEPGEWNILWVAWGHEEDESSSPISSSVVDELLCEVEKLPLHRKDIGRLKNYDWLNDEVFYPPISFECLVHTVLG